MLAEKILDAASVTAIMKDAREAPLTPGERAMMAFAEKVALTADVEVFDVADQAE